MARKKTSKQLHSKRREEERKSDRLVDFWATYKPKHSLGVFADEYRTYKHNGISMPQ